jgi:hypothetical protein
MSDDLTTSAPPPEPPILAAARAYAQRGWQALPLRPGSKKPLHPEWQRTHLPLETLLTELTGDRNLGLLTGMASGGLVDVDCDVPEASAAAAGLLPPTGRVHGRRGKPASHYWYVITIEEAESLPSTKYFMPNAGGGHTMLVELRADGCQTLVPPSRHPSGERLRWERSGEPGEEGQLLLRHRVGEVAACALLARSWPAQGLRDEAALALTGLLLRAGWKTSSVDMFVRLVARIAGDEEWRKRAKSGATAKRLAHGEPAWGRQALAERLRSPDGARAVELVCQWLSLPSPTGQGRSEGPAGAPPFEFTAPHSSAEEDGEGEHDNEDVKRDKGYESGRVLMHQVRSERLRWLWPGRIPLGKITILDGDPGLGKSLFTLDLLARVSTGREMPDGAPGVFGGGVLLSAEDGLTDTIAPRLRVAGADQKRIVARRTIPQWDSESGAVHQRGVLLPADLPVLAQDVALVGAKLLVIDPLMAYLDPRVNSWRDQDARAMLAPLARLAEEQELAVLILRHLTKSATANALYRGGGSIGLIGAARAGLLVAADPDDPEHVRVLASTKSNLGPPMPSLRYRIELPDEAAPEGEVPAPALVWLGECRYSAATILGMGVAEPGRGAAVAEAMEWLRDFLADGPRPSDEVKRAAQLEEISATTLRRARERLGVLVTRTGYGAAMQCLWELPSTRRQGDQQQRAAGATDQAPTSPSHSDAPSERADEHEQHRETPEPSVVLTSNMSTTEQDEHDWSARTAAPPDGPRDDESAPFAAPLTPPSACPGTHSGVHDYRIVSFSAPPRRVCLWCGRSQAVEDAPVQDGLAASPAQPTLIPVPPAPLTKGPLGHEWERL